MAFKILRKNCCGLDIHKTWIFACIGITDSNGRTEYKQARFSSFSNGLRDLADWLAKYSCSDVCMDLRPVYVRHGQAQLYPTAGHPPAP